MQVMTLGNDVTVLMAVATGDDKCGPQRRGVEVFMFGGVMKVGGCFSLFAKREVGDLDGRVRGWCCGHNSNRDGRCIAKACSVVVIQHGVSVGFSQVRSGAVVRPAWSCSDALGALFSRRSGGGDGHGDAGDGKG